MFLFSYNYLGDKKSYMTTSTVEFFNRQTNDISWKAFSDLPDRILYICLNTYSDNEVYNDKCYESFLRTWKFIKINNIR